MRGPLEPQPISGAASVNLIDCTHDAHAGAILAIFNRAIETSTALYDYVSRPIESMAPWFGDKARNGYPVLGACDGDGALLGFASYGTFRAWPAFKYSVEHSVYVREDQRGKGLGKILLAGLVERATAAQLHVMVGAIDADNSASIALHLGMGFAHVGSIRQAGFKFNRWLDVAFYQRTLTTPLAPVDG
jgi:phosphinothricin acetyltransferase